MYTHMLQTTDLTLREVVENECPGFCELGREAGMALLRHMLGTILYTIYYLLYTTYYILHTIYYMLYAMYYILNTMYEIRPSNHLRL